MLGPPGTTFTAPPGTTGTFKPRHDSEWQMVYSSKGFPFREYTTWGKLFIHNEIYLFDKKSKMWLFLYHRTYLLCKQMFFCDGKK